MIEEMYGLMIFLISRLHDLDGDESSGSDRSGDWSWDGVDDCDEEIISSEDSLEDIPKKPSKGTKSEKNDEKGKKPHQKDTPDRLNQTEKKSKMEAPKKTEKKPHGRAEKNEETLMDKNQDIPSTPEKPDVLQVWVIFKFSEFVGWNTTKNTERAKCQGHEGS